MKKIVPLQPSLSLSHIDNTAKRVLNFHGPCQKCGTGREKQGLASKCFIRIIHHILLVSVWLACMYVHHVHAWCQGG